MITTSFIYMLIGKRITLKERMVLKESLNEINLQGIVRMTRNILLLTLIAESAGILLMMIRFVPDFGVAQGLYYSVFHSISSFCNAGFDVLGAGQQHAELCERPADQLYHDRPRYHRRHRILRSPRAFPRAHLGKQVQVFYPYKNRDHHDRGFDCRRIYGIFHNGILKPQNARAALPRQQGDGRPFPVGHHAYGGFSTHRPGGYDAGIQTDDFLFDVYRRIPSRHGRRYQNHHLCRCHYADCIHHPRA